MKLLLTHLLLVGIISSSLGQGQAPPSGTMEGTVQDAQSKEVIEFATISIHQLPDSTLITGGITNEKGVFEIKKIPFGNHYVKIDFIGYKSSIQNISISAQKPNIKLAPTLLIINSTSLQTAEVTAETNMMRLGIDRKVFDVEKSQLNDGGNAIDVLKNTPTLDVDMNDNISLRGSQGVSVLINGKPSGLNGANRAAILRQIPASMIKNVEIITNPSAKYDPEGMTGIINIVLKKNKMQGISGNIAYTIGTMANKHNVTAGINFRNEKINVFANYNFNYRGSYNSAIANRKNIFNDGSYNFLEEHAMGNHVNYGHFAKVGFDYFINPKNTISLNASINPGKGVAADSIYYTFLDQTKEITSKSLRSIPKKDAPLGMNYNLNYTTVFKDPKQKLEFDANYSYFNDQIINRYKQEDLLVPSNSPALQYNSDIRNNHILNIQLDYTHPFKNKGKMELGAKGGYRLINNDFEFQNYNYANQDYETDLGISNNFQYSEQVYAVYGTYGQKIKKFSFQAGLRLEQALTSSYLITTNERYTNNYFSFFPSAHIGYELPKTQQIQLSYSRRINRPRIHSLNPFGDQTDPQNIRIGNPYLKPEYINSIELTYAKYWKKGSFTTSLYYRHTTDVIRRLYNVDAQGAGYIQFTNFDEVHSYGVELASSIQLLKWWRMNVSMNAYRMQEDGSNLSDQYRNSSFGGHANIGSSFRLPLDFGAQFNLSYRAPMVLVIGNITGMFRSSFAISKSFLKRSLKITLSIQDPFNVMQFGYDLADTNYSVQGTHRWESRVARLSISYDFGKMDMGTRRRMNQRGSNAGGGGGGVGF
ncbi:outer membrane beta-barrel family protein [Aureispira anguillae]|uniref:TonB-dependent receptor family protein n=1 Tax=Aureispira anguillae TaxID=2864201 RepID=A0A916DUV6_9BACT|nr:outer membrane beta-barrel family protein [Aureispira anguillae]BDS12865.1 TonB-dependent receptor family protein [Aureispira anguillae]